MFHTEKSDRLAKAESRRPQQTGATQCASGGKEQGADKRPPPVFG